MDGKVTGCWLSHRRGIGWMMMFNVWGVIWRTQKKIIEWTRESAANGTPIPDRASTSLVRVS